MSNPYDQKKVDAHVKEVANRTKEAREYFNIGENEKVIQDYACAKGLASGRMYVTQNYIGFRAALPKTIEYFPFRNIKKLEKVKMASISIQTTDGKNYDYGAFTQREEAYSILLHLWQNVPSYTIVPEDDLNPKSPRVTVNDGSMFDISLTEQRGKVDVDSARNGLRKLHQAKDMGLATLDELDRQREVVHGMHQRLEDMDVDLARNERHIRGIESIPGAIANKIVKDKSMKNRKEIVFEAREHKIEAAKKSDKEVEILYKFNNDKVCCRWLCLFF